MTRTRIVGKAVVLEADNVDTDQISPGTELMRSVDDGYRRWGTSLFAGQRYLDDRTPNPDFILNQPAWSGAEILITGENFGCGSSREWAVKALVGYGFRAILAVSFAEIFEGNCYRHNLLPITLPVNLLGPICDEVRHGHGTAVLTIDLHDQKVHLPFRQEVAFSLPEMQRQMFLEGIDQTGFAEKFTPSIAEFEKADLVARPWAVVASPK